MSKQKIGTWLMYAVSLGVLGFGALYIYTGCTAGLMPYHLRYLGVHSISELPANVGELMRTFVLIIGFAFSSVGVALFVLTRGLSNTAQRGLAWITTVVMLAIQVPIIFVMYHLATYTPWYLVAGMSVVAAIGLVLVRRRS